MKSLFSTTFAISLAAVTLQSVASAAPTTQKYFSSIYSGPKNEIVPGLILVKYPTARAKQLQLASAATYRSTGTMGAQMQFQSRIGNSGWTLWKVPAVIEPKSLMASIAKQPGVLKVQAVNRIYPLIDTPNDPDYGAIESDPTYVLDFGDTGVNFERLWNLTDISAMEGFGVFPNKWYTATDKPRNAPNIAIIDTGNDMAHPDFINAGGTSTNSAQGGQLDFSKSAQFRLGEVYSAGSEVDAHGHGSHVAGLAVASGNNGGFAGKGMIGTGYGSKASILRVFDDTGNGTDADAAAAIYYAADNGTEVINLSLGTTNYSQLFQDAVTYAWQKGCLVVCAGNEAGSGGGNLGPIYPAACSGALAVAANGPGQIPATTYTGYGRYVDLAAPGGDVVQSTEYIMIQFVYSTACRYDCSTSNNSALYPPYLKDYTYLAGTSMACPQVAGAASTYFAAKNLRQGDWNNNRVYRALETSADGVLGAPYGGWELNQGYGSLNMQALLLDVDTRGSEVGAIEGMVYWVDTPTANVQVRARKVSGGTTYSTTTDNNGYYRFEALPPGEYNVTTSVVGNIKSKRAKVVAGSDRTGFEFWVPNLTLLPFDDSAPVAARLEVPSPTATTVRVKHWAYDTETGLDSMTLRIGTTSGGSEIVAATNVYPEDPTVTFSGLNLAPGTYYVTGTYVNGAGMTTSKTTPFTIGGSATIQGTVTLGNYSGTAKQMTMQLLTPGTSTVVDTYTFNAVSGTNFSVPTTRTGNYDIRLKGPTWLAQKLTNRNLTASGIAGLSFSLKNGDVNGDNVVGPADLLQVRSAFGASSSSSNWNPNADLNGDGVVGPADLLIVRSNFGQSGE